MHYVNISNSIIIYGLRWRRIGFLSHFRAKNGGIFPFSMEPSYSCILLILNNIPRVFKAKISNKNPLRLSSKVDTFCK